MTKWDMSVNACMMARTTATCSLLEAMDILECWLDKGNHIKREMHHLLHSVIHYSFIQIPNPFFLCPFFIFHIFILLFSPFKTSKKKKDWHLARTKKDFLFCFRTDQLSWNCIMHVSSTRRTMRLKQQISFIPLKQY